MKILLIILVTSFLFNICSCTYTERIKDGKTAYARKQFHVAIPMLIKEFEKADNARLKGETAYMLGESFRRIHQSQSASDWYKKAQKQRFGKDTDIKYARMLQQLEDYDEARLAFQSAGRYAGDIKMYQEQIIACRKAKQWLAESSENLYKIESLTTNNNASDFSPVIYGNDKLLITSDRSESTGKENYKWTGKKYYDLYLLNTKAGTVVRFDADFNNTFHQGAPSFSPDKNTVFFTQCGSNEKVAVDYCKIMYSYRDSNGWATPEMIDFGNSDFNYLHPIISEDGKTLVFACNNDKGFGGYDLYYSIKLNDNDKSKWSVPLNMGNKINTSGNDVFPFLDKDTLYYSSDGHPGMGGLDIFRAEKKHQKWQLPENLRAPLNSGGDDFGFIIDKTSNVSENVIQLGYFSSNREGGQGSDDIYKFQKKPPPPIDTTLIIIPPEIQLTINLEGIVKEKLYKENNNPNSGISGYVDLMGASIHINTEDTAFTVGSDIDGTFYIALDSATDYYFKATKPNYFTQIADITTKGIILNKEHPDTTLYIEIVLEKIIKNQEITLENIYYDYDDDKIREDAKKPLDSLTIILKRNPNLNIQLSSHTDCRGANGYNEKLSQRRAESAVRYLIQNGINPDRLKAKGYGENKHAVDCKCQDCSDEEHQQNRRTTFLILEE
ncbi:MAG: OmpA family protein [Saprospiraceae bacterium]|nr:OmpA family protein [Saprospiraceae bacterium]